jgi:sulfide:quinone oxidoreductase
MLATERPPVVSRSQPTEHHQVVVIGGGNGGISVAAQLRRKRKSLDIAIVEPSDIHYYQPLWTLVGGGVVSKEVTRRAESRYIPRGVSWLREAAVEICPEDNALVTARGTRVEFDSLVVAPGIQINWGAIKGLRESIGRDGVCSNYSYEYVDRTWEFIRDFKGGTAVFTHPNTPIKCGGAPQKIMYLADDHFRRAGVRDRTNVIFASAGGAIFSVPKYAKTLNNVLERRQIDVRFRRDLTELRPESKEAVFNNLDTGETEIVHYDMIHVTPPQSAPDFIRTGPLANEAGWVDVDKHTLQHVHYPNVFSLGDASSLPTSKTGAAIRKQAPVLVANLLATLEGRPLAACYDGYAACPIVTGYGKLVMAEFDYDLNPRESMPFDQSKERLSMYLVKRHVLPSMYWRGILTGRV